MQSQAPRWEPRPPRQETADLLRMSEDEVKALFLPHLRQLGCVELEVPGLCYTPNFRDGQLEPPQWTPTPVRIDAIITFNPALEMPVPAMGVEFKKYPLSHANRGKHLRQAIDYRLSVWENGYGHLPVLMCPGFARRRFFRSNGETWSMSPGYDTCEADRRWVAAFGVGELQMHPHPCDAVSILFGDASLIYRGKRSSGNRRRFGESRGCG